MTIRLRSLIVVTTLLDVIFKDQFYVLLENKMGLNVRFNINAVPSILDFSFLT